LDSQRDAPLGDVVRPNWLPIQSELGPEIGNVLPLAICFDGLRVARLEQVWIGGTCERMLGHAFTRRDSDCPG
jgi:hypothetical protein